MRARLALLAAVGLLLTVLPGPSAEAVPRCLGRLATHRGTAGNNTINGTPGNDSIVAGGGNDTVNGLGGNDLICGGSGDDTLRGGNGNDRIEGGFGADTMIGNQGKDWVMYPGRQEKVDITIGDPNTGDGRVLPPENDVVTDSIEHARGGDAGDGFVGNDVRNRFEGGPGGDDQFGQGGNDLLFGQSGGDILNGQTGPDDFANGGRGNDDCDAEEEVNCEKP
jgi:Ca2+-binding RTX toxin-like protein